MVVTFLLVLSETWCFKLLRRVKTCMKIWRCYPPPVFESICSDSPFNSSVHLIFLFENSVYCLEFVWLNLVTCIKRQIHLFWAAWDFFFSFWFPNRHRWLIWYDIPSLKHGWSKIPEWIHSSQWCQQWYHPAEFLKIGKKVHISVKTA